MSKLPVVARTGRTRGLFSRVLRMLNLDEADREAKAAQHTHRMQFIQTNFQVETSREHGAGFLSNKRKCKPEHFYTEGDPFLLIKSLVDHEDIEKTNLLSEYIKENYSSQSKNRSFDAAPVEYLAGELQMPEEGGGNGNVLVNGGGNDCIYMEGFIQSIMPNFIEYIMESVCVATTRAGWHPYPRQLGVRCVERLLYHADGDLKLRLHTDSESIYTVVVMLSDSSKGDYTGGDFIIENRKDSSIVARVCPEVGDAIVFDSNALHGIDTIISGERKVLVVELWPYEDALEGDHRPSASSFHGRLKIQEMFITGTGTGTGSR